MENTLYINYTKNGQAIPDHKCEGEILKQASICVNGQSKEFQVSTENAVICARALKITGKITCNLEIMFEGTLLEMNRYCVIVYGYPYGFCDYVDKWTAQIISASLELKERHNKYKNGEMV